MPYCFFSISRSSLTTTCLFTEAFWWRMEWIPAWDRCPVFPSSPFYCLALPLSQPTPQTWIEALNKWARQELTEWLSDLSNNNAPTGGSNLLLYGTNQYPSSVVKCRHTNKDGRVCCALWAWFLAHLHPIWSRSLATKGRHQSYYCWSYSSGHLSNRRQAGGSGGMLPIGFWLIRSLWLIPATLIERPQTWGETSTLLCRVRLFSLFPALVCGDAAHIRGTVKNQYNYDFYTYAPKLYASTVPSHS